MLADTVTGTVMLKLPTWSSFDDFILVVTLNLIGWKNWNWVNFFPLNLITPFPLWCHILTPPLFPDDDFWHLVYSAVIWAFLFCLYTTSTAQVATCMLTIHDCIILKLDITWFTCVINKTLGWPSCQNSKWLPDVPVVYLSSKLWVLGII